ncbi:MAG: hypothetical protein ACI4Q9_01075 [Candidatus Methanomethylophilaceae archaeon]
MAEDHRRLKDALWDRFNQKDPRKQAWYYCSIADILEKDLGDTDAWKGYSGLCEEVFREYL